MKWWGWGDEDVEFTHEDKPELGPFLQRHLEIDVSRVSSPHVGFDEHDAFLLADLTEVELDR